MDLQCFWFPLVMDENSSFLMEREPVSEVCKYKYDSSGNVQCTSMLMDKVSKVWW